MHASTLLMALLVIPLMTSVSALTCYAGKKHTVQKVHCGGSCAKATIDFSALYGKFNLPVTGISQLTYFYSE